MNSELSERRTDDLIEASPMNENNSEQIVQSSTSEENHCSSLILQVAAAITADAEVAASECVEHPTPENAEYLAPECSESLPHSTATTAKPPTKIICQNGRHYVHCDSCFHFSNVLKLHSNNTKLPAIATKDRTMFREKIVKTHLNSKGHIKAAKAQRIAVLPKLQAATPMRKAFATGQLRLANKIGKFMLYVYHGAKSVTLSAHSFPSRVVVGELGNSFQYDCPDKSKPTLDLHYFSVNSHSEMLSCIVMSDKKNFAEKTFRSPSNFSTL